MGVLDGEAVIVTGAGRGLGRAFALDAAREGASVLVNDVDDAADAVATEITAAGGRALAVHGSVTSWEDAARIVERCVNAFGRLDGLVNNAGVIHKCPPWEEAEAQIRRTIEINLMGAIFVGTHALRVMAAQGHGSLVNITSSAQLGVPVRGTYSATKGALAALTYSWAIDSAERNVRVNGFAPSALTGITDRGRAQLPPPPEENAPVVTYLLSSLAAKVTGQILQYRGGDVVLVQHPKLSAHAATGRRWTAEAIGREFGPVLESNLEPLGWTTNDQIVPGVSTSTTPTPETSAAPQFPFPRDPVCPLNPSPEYRRLRTLPGGCPVTTRTGDEATLFTRYEDVVTLLSDTELFSSDPNRPGFPHVAPKMQVVSRGVLPLMDPPEHTRLRSIVNEEFAVQRVGAYRPMIQQVVNELIDEFVADGPPADLVDFAFAVPKMVICNILGVPYEDREFFRSVELSHGAKGTVAETAKAHEEFLSYLDGLVTRKEQEPGDDVLSRLIANAYQPGLVTRAELLTLAKFLVTAGFETSANMIALGTVLLLENPLQLKAMLADPGLVPVAVEEVLRLGAITHNGRRRVATQDTTIAGQAIPAGSPVIGAQDAANRDESVFSDPDAFDIHRANARRHLTFGYGRHLCAGAPLIRNELQVVFPTLFTRIPTLRLTTPAKDLAYSIESQMFGLESLPVTWRFV